MGLLLLVAVLSLVGCGGGGGGSLFGSTGGGTATAPDLSTQTASARLDFNQSVAKGRQEARSSILPAGTDSLSVVGLDVAGSKVFGPQEYPRPADDVLVVSVPVTVTRLLVTARGGQVDLTTFAADPRLRLGVTVTVPFSDFSVVGVVIKSMQTSKLPALVNATDVTATVAAESPKGLVLSYTWETTGGFTITSPQPYSVAVAMSAPATYSASGTIKVTVRDSEGATAVGTVPLTTVAKDAPVISSITVSPQPVMTVADIAAVVLDPLGGPLSYAWKVGGIPVGGNTDRVQWTSPGIPGTYLASLRATGVTGLYTDAAQAFTVGSSSPWPCRGRDLQARKRSPMDTPANAGQLDWAYVAGGRVYSSPSLGADGTLYVGCNDWNLYAIKPDGTSRWVKGLPAAVYSSPAIGPDGTVYVGCNDGKLYALNEDGSQKWVYSTGAAVAWSSPTIGPDGTVYVGSNDAKVYALTPGGALKWSFTTKGAVDSSPAIAPDGTVYVGSYDRNLYALNPADGTLKWAYATGDAIAWSSPAVGEDGTVYVGSHDGNLYAVSSGGALKWAFKTGGSIAWSSPAIGSDGTVYVGSDDGKLYAVKSDGTLRWSFAAAGFVRSSPAVGSDGTVYVGSNDNAVYAVNPDGSQKWWYATTNVVLSSPTIGKDGHVYVGSADARVYAFK